MNRITILVCLVSLLVNGIVSEEIPSIPNPRKNTCGGTITADSNSLSYPGVPGESLIPGETCVWTIHLDTTRDFRINFTDLDVSATNPSCQDGAVRFYSLSNLVPPDRIDEYSFCSGNSPSDTFYLGGNIAVLVLYVSPYNLQPGSGFTINWSGSSFDQLRTKHVATFSTTDRGVISYPGIGTYENSLAATWLVSKKGLTELQLNELQLESCSNPDPCTCDALLIYEISSLGTLKETTRHCSDVSSPITTSSLPSSFILAFFTDFIADSSGATGFSAVYYPAESTTEPPTTATPSTTTTTTELPPETTTPVIETTTAGSDTECGAILTSYEGSLNYKYSSLYKPNERCVWIISPENADRIAVTLFNIDDKPIGDGIVISPVHRSPDEYLLTNELVNTSGYHTFEFTANVLIVTLYSDYANEGFGFRLEYSVTSNVTASAPDTAIHSGSEVWPRYTPESYPTRGSGNYPKEALGTIIYSPNFRLDSNWRYVRIFDLWLDPVCSCCDLVYVYEFSAYNSRWNPHSDEITCGGAGIDENRDSHDMLLIIFKSDDGLTGQGFDMQFAVKPN